MRSNPVLRVAGLVVLGLALGLLCVEVALRIVDPPVEVFNPLHGFHDGDTRLGWRGKPNIRRRFHTLDFDVVVEHDANGFRRPDPAVPDDAQGSALFLGDSFTWGWGVGQGELFTDELQRALPPRHAIVNRGVNAFGTAQELLLLQDELALRRYDKVVVFFCGNDLSDNVDGKEHRPAFALAGEELVPRNLPAPASLQNPLEAFLDEHSRLALFASYHLALLKNRLRAKPRDAEVEPGDAAATIDFTSFPGFAITRRLLREIALLARAHGAEPFLVYIPPRSEMTVFPSPSPYDRAVHAMIEQIAREDGFTPIEIGPRLRDEAKKGAPLAFAHDDHWNAAGHRAVAHALLESPLFADWRR